MFIIEKLLKRKSPVGCAAHRGTAAEEGICFGLVNQNASLAQCQEIAIKRYDYLTGLSTDPNRKTERDAVPGIVSQGLDALRHYGIPSGLQKKVVYETAELPLPIVGFIDLDYEQHGRLIDIKTQLKLTSSIKVEHARQVSLYKHATSDNYEAGVAYVTPKKSAIYGLENSRHHLNALIRIAQTLERFLALSDDPMVLAGLVSPNFSSFYWNDPGARRVGLELWGY